MATCMNGLTRLSLSLTRSFRKYCVVKIPQTSSGKRRPCGTLLQLVVVMLRETHRIGRSVEVFISVKMEQNCNTTRFTYHYLLFREQQQAGSLTGAVPCRKNIDRTQRQTHLAWKSRVECEGKSLSNCILKSKKCRMETWA